MHPVAPIERFSAELFHCGTDQ